MTKREVGSLAFKLAGIYAMIHTIGFMQFLFVLGDINRIDAPYGKVLLVAAAVLPFLLLVALTCILILSSDRLSARMFGDSGQEPGRSACAQELQPIAFSVLGAFIFASALPDFLRIAGSLSVQVSDPVMLRRITLGTWLSAIGILAKVALAVGLFFGGRGLSRLWFRLRTGGHPKVDE